MKITKRQLRQIIKEEKAKLMEQPDIPDVMGAIGHGKFQPREEFEGSMMDLDDHNELMSQIERMIYEFERKGYDQSDVVHAIAEALGEFR